MENKINKNLESKNKTLKYILNIEKIKFLKIIF